MTVTTSATAPDTLPSARAGVLAGAGLVAGTTVVNVAAAAALRAGFDVSADFEALQTGPIATATLISLLAGAGVYALLRKFRSGSADRIFVIGTVVLGLLSMAGPLGLLGADTDSVPGWSEAAVWSLVPLHVIPTVAAVALPRITRR